MQRTNPLIETLKGMDYKGLYRQWRMTMCNNWYTQGETGKWMSQRLDAFRANLTAAERLEDEREVEMEAFLSGMAFLTAGMKGKH